MNSVNKLILGTVQMGLSYGINNKRGKIPLEESLEILKYAYESGIKILDSAPVYGDAHAIIGEYHDRFSNKKFSVITKIPAGISFHEINETVHNFCEVLKVDKLEALMFHSFSSYETQPDLLDGLLSLKSEGLLNYVGVSVYTNKEVEVLIEDDRVDLIQLPFNLLDNISQRGEVLKKAKKQGKIIHTRSAFLQGLFFKDLNESNPVINPLKQHLKKIHLLSEQYEVDTAALALKYCISQSYIDKVLIGVDSVKQLKENLDAGSKNIKNENEFIKEVDKIRVENSNLLNPTNWQLN